MLDFGQETEPFGRLRKVLAPINTTQAPCGLSGEGLRKVEKGGAGAVQKHYKKAHNLPRLRRKFYKLHSKLNKEMDALARFCKLRLSEK